MDDFDVDELIEQLGSPDLPMDRPSIPQRKEETQKENNSVHASPTLGYPTRRNEVVSHSDFLSTAPPSKLSTQMAPEKLKAASTKSPDDWLGTDNEKSESDELMAALGFSRSGNHTEDKFKVESKVSSTSKKSTKVSSRKNSPPTPPSTTTEKRGKNATAKQMPSDDFTSHKNEFVFSSKPPAGTTTENKPEDFSQPKSIFDALTFLSTKSQSESPEPIGENVQSQPIAEATKKATPTPKKKILKTASSGSMINSSAATLHVPSHLVDEEELKTICSSLKSLYGNQLQLLESSYKEQIEILMQSSQRKEEMLREEMKIMQKEYEQRIDRLKSEANDSDKKSVTNFRDEFSNLSNKLSRNIETLFSQQNDNLRRLSTENSQMLNQQSKSELNQLQILFNENFSTMVKLAKVPDTSQHEIKIQDDIKELKNIMSQTLEKLETSKVKDSSLYACKIEETQRKFSSDLAVMNKHHLNRIKDIVLRMGIDSIKKSMQVNLDETLHRNEKLESHIKDCRKDLRRLASNMEQKNDAMVKSQTSIECEQKSLTQNLHDLLTITKLGSIAQPVSNGATGEMASMQQQYQHEMEIKLLREERNSLSDSIAQMQMERRKFSEEKLNLEKDKMELERDRIKLRELESTLKMKAQEIDETKLVFEKEKREALSLHSEAESKQKELERERIKLRDNWQLLEEKIKSQESSFRREKLELDRERQYLEKLRTEMLCSSCLNPTRGRDNSDLFRSSNPHMLRSDGDGLDVSRMEALSKADKEYFQHESQYLDQLYAKQFH